VSTLIEKLPSLAGFMPFDDRSTWSLLILRDGFDQLQVVYHRGSNEDIGTLLAGLNEESVVAVRGRVKLDDRVKLDGVELFLGVEQGKRKTGNELILRWAKVSPKTAMG
jgi:hypothetical protein